MSAVKNKIGEKVETYKLKVLTPIHIGTGNRFTQMDYVVRGNYVLVLYVEKAIDYLLKYNSKAIDDTVLSDIAEGRFSWNNYLPKPIPEELIKYKIEIDSNVETSEVERKGFWEAIRKDLSNLYIPASEIKGFIRTAIIYCYIKDNWDRFKGDLEKIKPRFNFRNSIENRIFGDPTKDPMKYLKIEDVNGDFRAGICGVKLMFSPNRSHLKEFIEIIIGNSSSYPFKVKIWEDRLNTEGDIDKYIVKWKEACYRFMGDYLEAEIKFWEDVSNGNLANYIKDSQIANLFNKARNIGSRVKSDLERLRKENTRSSPLLRVGKHTGYFVHTIGLLLRRTNTYSQRPQDYNVAPLGNDIGARNAKRFLFPLTRRLTLDDQTLGWCRLVESDEDNDDDKSCNDSSGGRGNSKDINNENMMDVFMAKGWRVKK